MVGRRQRVAVLGGDGRRPERWDVLGEVVVYQARRDGGNGELKRLEAALRAGSYDVVVILSRWNGHAATRRVRRVCKALGVAISVMR